MKRFTLITVAIIMALIASFLTLYTFSMPIKTAMHQIYQAVVGIQAILLFGSSFVIWSLIP